MGYTVFRFTDAQDWAQSCAFDLAQSLLAARAKAGTDAPVRLALPGGATPKPIFEALLLQQVDWRGVEVCPSDDRCVAEDHPARNRSAMARMLSPVLQPNLSQGARIEPLETLDAQAAPNVVLLGYGNDRHIASLFPNGEGMAGGLDPSAVPGIVFTVPEPLPPEAPFARVSFNLSALLAADAVLIAGKGADKAQTLADALNERCEPLSPLAHLISKSATPVRIYLLT